jgi:hypothetical protein
MSSATPPIPPVYRHPLGLPAGSVRAILSLLIVAQVCLFLALPPHLVESRPMPLYLHALMLMVMLYFVARGREPLPGEPRQPAPLYLPRFFIRSLLILGLAAVVGWQLYENPERVYDRLKPVEAQLADWPYILATLAGSFVLGRLLRIGPWRNAAWFQDFLAWVSLIAMIAVVAEMCLTIFVNPGFLQSIDRTVWECVLTGIVTTYFAARA